MQPCKNANQGKRERCSDPRVARHAPAIVWRVHGSVVDGCPWFCPSVRQHMQHRYASSLAGRVLCPSVRQHTQHFYATAWPEQPGEHGTRVLPLQHSTVAAQKVHHSKALAFEMNFRSRARKRRASIPIGPAGTARLTPQISNGVRRPARRPLAGPHVRMEARAPAEPDRPPSIARGRLGTTSGSAPGHGARRRGRSDGDEGAELRRRRR
jgi:hypothetical protein